MDKLLQLGGAKYLGDGLYSIPYVFSEWPEDEKYLNGPKLKCRPVAQVEERIWNRAEMQSFSKKPAAAQRTLTLQHDDALKVWHDVNWNGYRCWGGVYLLRYDVEFLEVAASFGFTLEGEETKTLVLQSWSYALRLARSSDSCRSLHLTKVSWTNPTSPHYPIDNSH